VNWQHQQKQFRSSLPSLKAKPSVEILSTWVFQNSIIYNETRAKELASLTAEQLPKINFKKFTQTLHNVPCFNALSLL